MGRTADESREQSKGSKTRKTKEKTKKEEGAFEQNKKPFPKKWMNDCYQKLIFPNPKCSEIMEQISQALPRHVLKAQTSELKQQALFLLLGEAFTEQHFPKHKYNVGILEPPKIDRKQKEKYLAEMKSFLKKGLAGAMKDCGYPTDITQYHRSDDKMGKYLQEIRGTFKEAYTTNVTLDAFEEESRQIHKSVSKHKSSNDDDDDEAELELGEEVGVTYTQETDAAGRAFVDFMSHDNNKKDDYKKQIKDRQLSLSLSLRQYFWWEFFETLEKRRLNLKSGDNVKMAITRDFDEKLKASMKEQKLPVATRSSNAKDIDVHVIELFDMSPPLKELDIDDILMKTTLTVNMADIHSSNYTPVISLLLFPFHLTYKKKDKEKDEDYIKQLAMQLSCFSKYTQLSQKEIFILSEEIIHIVAEGDSEYFDHMKKTLSLQSNKAKPLDFPPEVFLKDTRASHKVFSNLLKQGAKGEDDVRERYADELSDPAIYIRKWIGQVFVGVLSVNGMMWAWDQIFLNDWSRETIKNIAISILALIKPWMLRASMYSGARKVFIEEPSKLYTSDLRNALKCLKDGGSFSEIPPTRNFLVSQQKSAEEKKQKAVESKPSTSSKFLLKPFSVPVLPFGSNEDFRIDVDLNDPQDDDDDEELIPVQEPLPDSENEDEKEPERVRDPNEPFTPPDSPPPPLTEKGWVPQDPDPINPPAEAKIDDPFEFYIDYVRFLPDNVRVCKVTAKLLNSNLPKNAYKPIVAFPLLESYQRSPSFRSKQIVNPNKEEINPDSVVIFKVYGYQESTKDIVAVGSCLLSPFVFSNDKYVLQAGGHQIRLRHGTPNPEGGVENLKESDMNHNSPIAGSSICVRLLKSDKIYDPTPKYEDGYYDSSNAKPNATEVRLFDHYTNMEDYSILSVGDELRSIQRAKGEDEMENSPEMQKYLENLLDHIAFQKKKRTAIPDLDYSLFVKYEGKQGVNICIQGAFGLPKKVEGFYIHAFGMVLPGKETKNDLTDDQKKKLQLVTGRIDLNSYHCSPDWLDLKTTLYPSYDEHTLMVVQIFGIKLKYLPSPEALEDSLLKDLQEAHGETSEEDIDSLKGAILETEQGSFEINYEKPFAWSVLPIFRNGYVQGGLHLLAIFKGKPHKTVLSLLEKERPVEEVLKKSIAKGLIELEKNGFMEVEIYDGHVESEDLPEPAIDTQLTALEIKDSALHSRHTKYDTKFSDFVLENMKENIKTLGTAGTNYERESYNFQRESNLQFLLSLNKALQKAGKPQFRIKF